MNGKTIIMVSGLTLWSLGEKHGGPAFTKTIEGYMKDGWEVYLISDVASNMKSDLLDSKHNIVLSGLPYRESKLMEKMGKIGVIPRWLEPIYITPKFISECERIIETKDKQSILLYAYEVTGVSACAQLARKYSLPLVTRFQGTVLSFCEDTPISRLRKYAHYMALSEPADLIVMTDDGTMGDRLLAKLGNKSKCLFLRNGFDLMRNELALRIKNYNRNEIRDDLSIGMDEIMFLTVSRLVNWKKVERAIDGFAIFCKSHERGKLVIVGEGPERKRLQLLSDELGISKRVIFAGAVAHDEVYYYMKASDVFLSFYDMSNLGNPLMEAMAIGRCVVTLNNGDTGTVITDKVNGRLVEMNELNSIGKIMSELADDKDERVRFGTNAYQYAKENFYSWETRIQIELEAVNKLIAH